MQTDYRTASVYAPARASGATCLSTSIAYQQLLPTHPMMTWLALGSDAARSLMRSNIFVSPSPCTHRNEFGMQEAVQAYSMLAKDLYICSCSGAAQRQRGMASPRCTSKIASLTRHPLTGWEQLSQWDYLRLHAG